MKRSASSMRVRPVRLHEIRRPVDVDNQNRCSSSTHSAAVTGTTNGPCNDPPGGIVLVGRSTMFIGSAVSQTDETLVNGSSSRHRALRGQIRTDEWQ